MTGAAYYMTRDEIADAIGSEAADRLTTALGGTKFYVSEKKMKDKHPLIDPIGQELAEKFAALAATGIGGLIIEIPIDNGSRQKIMVQRLRELVERGDMTADEIAAAVNVTVRTVRRMRAKLREEREAMPASPGHLSGASTR